MANPNSLANLRPPWKPGESGNLRGPPPVTRALRALFEQADASDRTRAMKFARMATARAFSKGRDSVLWAKLILERVDGLVRQEIELQHNMGEQLAAMYQRWLRPDDDEPEDAAFTVADSPEETTVEPSEALAERATVQNGEIKSNSEAE